MEYKFKVGDKVKVLNKHDYNTLVEIGKVYTVIKIKDSPYPYELDCGTCMMEKWLKLVEEEPYYTTCSGSGIAVASSNIQEIINDMMEQTKKFSVYPMYMTGMDYGHTIKNNKTTIMSKITTFAKNLVLSADEKLLRKYGLHDECGNHTDEAEELVIAKLVKENEAYLIELAKGMELEEKNK